MRLLATGTRFLCEQPTVAEELRSDPEAIPNFIEECLRLDGPIKGLDPGALSYLATFIIRGLNDLPLRFRRRS